MADRCPHCNNTGTVTVNGCRYNCMRCRERNLLAAGHKNPRVRIVSRLHRRIRRDR